MVLALCSVSRLRALIYQVMHRVVMSAQGAVFEGRKGGRMSPEKAAYARPAQESAQLEGLGQ